MEREVDADTLRRIRIERLEGRHLSQTLPAGRDRERASTYDFDTGNMVTESRSSRRERDKEGATEGHRRRHRDEERRHRDEEKRPRRRRRGEGDREQEEVEYVYGAPRSMEKKGPTVRVSETRRLGRGGESSEEETLTRSRTVRDKPKERKIKVVYMTRDEMKAEKQRAPKIKTARDERPRDDGDSIRRSREHHSRRPSVVEVPLPPSPPRRDISTRVLHSEARPALKRSNTTSSHVPSTRPHNPSTGPTSPTAKRSSFIGSFFGAGLPQHHEPEKLVECLTCLSDDVPRSKSAKLKCGHRMCHSCLKRIFRLSVNDPAHMPPKCCTADHIPLNHVEKLFNNDFKKNWNRKFQEFSTKNRIYCPARRCGEWIKPGNIHKDGDGKKYGKCGRCRLKVCCLCNGKWHGGKDCPKDEETNRLLAQAKQAGWQRCYNCRTMVELKEGCNHMTCRCNAEFCMICGLKWKSCNCPWFNYEAVEEDRLQHMQVPRDAPIPNHVPGQYPNANPNLVPHPNETRRPRRQPATYHEEITERQRQERRDEAIARRMQRTALNDGRGGNGRARGADEGEGFEDYQGGIGDIHGVGNGAAHFMNQDYVRAAQNILTGNFDQANPAANYVLGVANARGPRRSGGDGVEARGERPVLRRHTMREREYNDTLPRERAAERVVPRRSRTDYVAEAQVHEPRRREETPPPREERVREREVRGDREGRGERAERGQRISVLAGLGGKGNRVSAWRSFVRPGVEPEEGVISLVP